MSKGCIYYTDNRCLDEPIYQVVQDCIKESGLPITSVSLKFINFGRNFVIERRKGAYTMILQIIKALEESKEDNVFFTEHDVLYHNSHFDFTPPRDDTYYYNTNVWRWRYHSDIVSTYDNPVSLSALCCNRELALSHFNLKKEYIDKHDWDLEMSNEPWWSRYMGYEPGYKKRPYLPDEKWETWQSEFPNVDIRHRFCFSHRKTRIEDFMSKPTGWIETTPELIPGWNIMELFAKYNVIPNIVP